MTTQIKLPNLGENIESGDVLSIFVSEGDTVLAEQDLLEVETDKATVPVPSPQSGRVLKVLVAEGDTIEVGTPLFEFEGGGAAPQADAASEPAAAPSQPQEQAPPPAVEQAAATPPPPAPQPVAPAAPAAAPPTAPAVEQLAAASRPQADASPAQADDRSPSAGGFRELPQVDGETPGDGHSATAASPTVRRLARQLGVDLRRVRPTGEAGRITAEDVTDHVRNANERAARSGAGPAPPGAMDTDDWGAVRRERMTRLRQTIARNMTASYSTIPQLTNFDDADITELEQLRQESKADYAARNIKLTTMPFLIKAVASSLKQHPLLNASIDLETNTIIYKEYVNLGIAVDSERGLIVPVLRDADRMNIPEIAAELARLASMARDGSFKLDDIRGGTFTISNLGAVGGTYSTPIINPPEVAILLAGRSRTMPSYVKDRLERRLMMPLSITYDHRVVDGAAAARFLNDVQSYLSAPGRLLLAP